RVPSGTRRRPRRRKKRAAKQQSKTAKQDDKARRQSEATKMKRKSGPPRGGPLLSSSAASAAWSLARAVAARQATAAAFGLDERERAAGRAQVRARLPRVHQRVRVELVFVVVRVAEGRAAIVRDAGCRGRRLGARARRAARLGRLHFRLQVPLQRFRQ